MRRPGTISAYFPAVATLYKDVKDVNVVSRRESLF